MTNLMTANQAGQPARSAREQYYAELDALELDDRMREAVAAARSSQTQHRLFESWRVAARQR